MFALLPHPLHHEVAQLPTSAAALPHVPSGVEVQGVMRTVLARFVELASGSAIQGNYFMKQLCIKCSVRVLLIAPFATCDARLVQTELNVKEAKLQGDVPTSPSCSF